MTGLEAITLGQEAVNITLLLSAPPLIVGLVVGLAIAVFQATTQIQEMTITFVPKIVAVMLSLLFFASWMMIKLNDYTQDLLLRIPDLVR
ncbi:MAG: flagellar biosynthesis protein FliQ [Desulfobulbaceae bacterium]|nr:flagellar biosynthesis protein FliQ [Desulfobulbaceae bacterium]